MSPRVVPTIVAVLLLLLLLLLLVICVIAIVTFAVVINFVANGILINCYSIHS